jgi:hypothetical protein
MHPRTIALGAGNPEQVLPVGESQRWEIGRENHRSLHAAPSQCVTTCIVLLGSMLCGIDIELREKACLRWCTGEIHLSKGSLPYDSLPRRS